MAQMFIFRTTLVCLLITSFQEMTVDEKILSMQFDDLYKSSSFVALDMWNYKEHGLVNYDYCTDQNMGGHFTFMDFNVEKMGIRLDEGKGLKEVLVVLKMVDAEQFYRKMVERYGMPGTTSLSKYYIEKHGFRIPPEMEAYNERSYDSLPQPKIADFQDLRSVVWYDLNENTEDVQTDIFVTNRTDPSSKFMEKEIWVVFKKAKSFD